MKRLTDKGFVYRPSFDTDIGARFKKIFAEQRRQQKAEAERAAAEKDSKVKPIKRSGA